MKKLLLLTILSVFIVVAWCGKTVNEWSSNDSEKYENMNAVSWDNNEVVAE